MINGLITFAGYTLPATIRPSDEDSGLDTAAQARPRGSGSVTQSGRREPTQLVAVGDIAAATPDLLDQAVQDLKAKLYAGYGDLYFGRSDRYYKQAQCRTFGHSTNEGLLFGVVAEIKITFEAADYPEAFASSGATSALSAGGGTVTVSGDAAVLPVWTITVGSAGSGPFTLSNAATGEAATLAPADGSDFGAGDVIILTRDGYSVTRGGVEEFGLLDGRIPRLLAGANVVTLSAGGTATVSALSVTYVPQYS